jgi:hypothetical protein
MNLPENAESGAASVLGQKYAFATASLLVGIASFIQLLGLERAILAILFGWLALRRSPGPALGPRRTWARIGIALGIAMLVLVPVFLTLYFDRVREFIEALERLQ